MNIWVNSTTCVAALLLLAACGGSSDGQGPLISAEEEALRVFADADEDGNPDQDAADVLARGDTLVARRVSSASWQEDYNDGMADLGGYTRIDGVLQLQGDGDDLLVTFPYDGGTTTIRIVDAASIEDSQVIIEAGGIYFDLFIGSGGLNIADLLDDSVGQGYAHRVGVYYNDGVNGFGSQTDAIIGAETQDSMIDQLGMDDVTASYDGFGRIRIRRDDADWSNFNASLGGDVSMTADFGAGTIAGAMTDLFYEERMGSTEVESFGVDGSLIMNETGIQANAFSGNLSADSALAADDPGIATVASGVGYSGAFYGDVAQEIGGTFEGGGSFEGQGYMVQGTFIGDAIE